MLQVHARYENGKLQLPKSLSPERLKDSRVKVIVTVAKGAHQRFGRDEQDNLREQLLTAQGALSLRTVRNFSGQSVRSISCRN